MNVLLSVQIKSAIYFCNYLLELSGEVSESPGPPKPSDSEGAAVTRRTDQNTVRRVSGDDSA